MARRKRKGSSGISLLTFAILCMAVGYILNDILDGTYALEEKQVVPVAKIENPDISSHYIDVGQGDSIFIELPNKECMLIDAGERDYGKKVTQYIKQLGYNKIDYLVATHPHTDHIGGMREVVNNFDIGYIYMPKVTANTSNYINLLKSIDNKGLKIKTAKAGVDIINNDDYKISIIAPNSDKYDDLNNYSAVIKLTYKNINYLYMADAEKLSEEEIKTDVKADIIKVGHHGSLSSSSLAFIKKVKPSYAIIQVGHDNSYGHPNKNILNRYDVIGAKVYRTDLNGNIVVSTNGTEVSIASEK